MNMNPFKLERYFAKHEFVAKHLLSSSDCQALSMQELLDNADKETLALWNNLQLSYTETNGHILLRQEIAKLYSNISIEHIATCIPAEGIYLALNSLLQAGDQIICTTPMYQSLFEIPHARGCEIKTWLPDDELHFQIHDLASLMSDKVKLLIINFPHNPTGAHLTQQQQNNIVELAHKHNCYIFSDEMYRFLERTPYDTLPSFCDIYDKGICLGGLSKSFGLPGLRQGWLVSQDANKLQACQQLKDYISICASAPGEILSIMALQQKERILSQQKQLIQDNLALFHEFVSRHADVFTWQPPPASSIGLAKLLHTVNAEQFCDDLVSQTGIMMVPSSMFDYGNHHVRIGYGRSNFKQALEALDFHLQKVKQ